MEAKISNWSHTNWTYLVLRLMVQCLDVRRRTTSHQNNQRSLKQVEDKKISEKNKNKNMEIERGSISKKKLQWWNLFFKWRIQRVYSCTIPWTKAAPVSLGISKASFWYRWLLPSGVQLGWVKVKTYTIIIE